MYEIIYLKKAKKDLPLLAQNKAWLGKAKDLIEIIKVNPYQNPPPYEKLKGDKGDMLSRRINDQHRLVYEVNKTVKEVIIHSLWSHYEF